MPDRRSLTIPARAGHTDIRRNNLEVVLRHLWAAETASRAGIAARAGLTRATVSRLVAELIDLGLVSETGMAADQGQGRPATQLAVTGRHVLAIGAEINVNYLAVLAVDLANREVYAQRRAFDAHRQAQPAACGHWPRCAMPAWPRSPRPWAGGAGSSPGLASPSRA